MFFMETCVYTKHPIEAFFLSFPQQFLAIFMKTHSLRQDFAV